jgi:hypothetical protein
MKHGAEEKGEGWDMKAVCANQGMRKQPTSRRLFRDEVEDSQVVVAADEGDVLVRLGAVRERQPVCLGLLARALHAVGAPHLQRPAPLRRCACLCVCVGGRVLGLGWGSPAHAAPSAHLVGPAERAAVLTRWLRGGQIEEVGVARALNAVGAPHLERPASDKWPFRPGPPIYFIDLIPGPGSAPLIEHPRESLGPGPATTCDGGGWLGAVVPLGNGDRRNVNAVVPEGNGDRGRPSAPRRRRSASCTTCTHHFAVRARAHRARTVPLRPIRVTVSCHGLRAHI